MNTISIFYDVIDCYSFCRRASRPLVRFVLPWKDENIPQYRTSRQRTTLNKIKDIRQKWKSSPPRWDTVLSFIVFLNSGNRYHSSKNLLHNNDFRNEYNAEFCLPFQLKSELTKLLLAKKDELLHWMSFSMSTRLRIIFGEKILHWAKHLPSTREIINAQNQSHKIFHDLFQRYSSWWISVVIWESDCQWDLPSKWLKKHDWHISQVWTVDSTNYVPFWCDELWKHSTDLFVKTWFANQECSFPCMACFHICVKSKM